MGGTSFSLSLRPDRWAFFALSSVILLVVGVAYGPRVFIVGMTQPKMHSALIRVHVAFVSLWLCAFAAQVLFAILGKFEWHRRFGNWAFAIAGVWTVTALLVLGVLLHQDPTAGAESLILLTRLLIFAGFTGMAWLRRTRPAEHKRWMILAMSQAIIGGISRLPVAWLHDLRHATEVALVFPLALAAYDWTRQRRLNPATLWGGAIIVVVQTVRFPLSTTPVWLAIARWIGSLGL